jgi:soluble lytic murein transglycosylase
MKYMQSISIFSLLISIALSSFHATTLNADAEDMSAREVQALLYERMDGLSQSQAHSLTLKLMKLCKKYDFSVSSVLALISAESSFDKEAKSSVGAIGLMQVMPQTAKFIAHKSGITSYHRARDLKNPEVNLAVGIAYLSYLRDRYAQSHSYLAAYNMGPSKFNRMVRKRTARPESVKKYVANIHHGVYQIRQEAQELAYADMN